MNPLASRQIASNNSIRFPQIDMLRGMAALVVVFSHYIPHWDRFLSEIWVLVPGHFGNYAVRMFFVVSGFVIFFTLYRSKSVMHFSVLRFSRLYPAYWASLVIATLSSILLFDNNFWLGGFVTNTTMFQEFLGYPNLDNVYWSITAELAFYINAAWLFAFGLHHKPKTVVLLWLLLSSAWGFFIYDPDVDSRSWLALIFVFDYSSYFSLGIIFFDVIRSRWSPASIALIFFAVLVQGILRGWEGLVVAVGITIIFVIVLRGNFDFLVNRVTLWLGSISYSLYLIHRNLGYEILDWLHLKGVGPIMGIMITVIVALLLAAALTYFVERPASTLIRTKYYHAIERC